MYIAPYKIDIGKRKPRLMTINVNERRKWHYQTYSKVKKTYEEIVSSQFKGESHKKIAMEMVVYYPDKRKRDRMNVLAMHEKFFSDALVKAKIIPDDNDNIITSHLFRTGGVDKENPRVEIIIHDI